MFKKLNIRNVLLSALIGGGAAFALFSNFFQKYTATIALPYTIEAWEHRPIEMNAFAVDQLNRFAASRGLTEDPGIKAYARQLMRGRETGVLTIERVPRIGKKDVRALPEAVAKDLTARSLGVADINIIATASSAAAADKLAQHGMDYFESVALRTKLSESIAAWSTGGTVQIAELKSQITGLQTSIASNARRLAVMSELRERYKEGFDIATGSTRLQVQLSGSRGMSPLQQLIDLEVDGADLREKLRLAEDKIVETETLMSVANAIAPIISKSETAQKLADALGAQIAAAPRPAAPKLRLPVDQALSQMSLQLAKVSAQFVDVKPLTAAPVVIEPSRFMMIGFTFAGLLLGALGYLLVAHPADLLQLARSGRNRASPSV